MKGYCWIWGDVWWGVWDEVVGVRRLYGERTGVASGGAVCCVRCVVDVCEYVYVDVDDGVVDVVFLSGGEIGGGVVCERAGGI